MLTVYNNVVYEKYFTQTGSFTNNNINQFSGLYGEI